VSTTYVDGTTPLDAAHMNALQQKVEKAAANGYPSLDAAGKVPVAQLPGAGTLPSPVVNGQWIKGVGGAAVWQPIAAADLPVGVANGVAGLDAGGQVPLAQLHAVGSSPSASITAANTDITPTTTVTQFTIYPNGGGSVRSIVGPAQGARVSFWNSSSTPVTFKQALSGGTGAVLQNKNAQDLILNPNEGVDYAWDGGGNWRQIGEARRTAALIQTVVPTTGTQANFFSIPQNSTTLRIAWSGIAASGGDTTMFMQFNFDTGTNYFWSQNEVSAGAANPASGVSVTGIRVGALGSNGVANGEIVIPNYSSSLQKGASAIGAMSSGSTTRNGVYGGAWTGTAPITMVGISTVAGFANASFSLYGE
jgi:hypothetical protein